MKNLLFIMVFFTAVTFVNASNNPVKNKVNNSPNLETVKTELVISTKGVKKLEDINVVDFHKDTYLKLMLRIKRANKIC